MKWSDLRKLKTDLKKWVCKWVNMYEMKEKEWIFNKLMNDLEDEKKKWNLQETEGMSLSKGMSELASVRMEK